MRQRIILYVAFLVALGLNIGFWSHSRHLQAVWVNVPPAPAEYAAAAVGLGDRQLAYRFYSKMIQNFGTTGGRFESLEDYNYEHLYDWFMLADALDPYADFIPFLAGYNFGLSREDAHLDYVIDYLTIVGQRPHGQKWRFLGHAVYLARYRQNDLEKAMQLAEILAGLEMDNMPAWTVQMPAFIAAQQGNRKGALNILMTLLTESADDMHPNEVFFMIDYICERLLEADERRANPYCRQLDEENAGG